MLANRRTPVETHPIRASNVAAPPPVLALVIVLSMVGPVAAEPSPPDQKRGERESSSSASAVTTDDDTKQRPEADDPTARLVAAVLRRREAITSGDFVYDFRHKNVQTDGIRRFRFAAESWIMEGLERKWIDVNHERRLLSIYIIPQIRELERPPRLDVNLPKPWLSQTPRVPIHAGTIWRDATWSFVHEHAGQARFTGEEEVNDVLTKRLEWDIAPHEWRAFGIVNEILLEGGTLRLYVSERLGGVLPRFECIDRSGVVQATMDAVEFKEVAPAIFVPSRLEWKDGADEATDELLKVERINQEIPAEEFSDLNLPAGTFVHDQRPRPIGGDYPFAQFATRLDHPHGLPSALLAEMDRDVLSPNEANAPTIARQKRGQEPSASADAAQPTRRKPTDTDDATLRYVGRTFDDWRRQLINDLEPKTRIEAITALAAFGEHGQADDVIAAIARVLDGNDQPLLIAAACGALARLGPASLPLLIDAVSGPNETLVVEAAESLGVMGPRAKAAVPALLAAARRLERHPRVQQVGSALGRIGPNDDQVKAFIDLLRRGPVPLRMGLVSAAGKSGDTSGMVRVLLAAIADDDENVRLSAAMTLARIGPATPEIIDVLSGAAREGDAGVRRNLVLRLAKDLSNPETMVPVLAEALVSGGLDENCQTAIITALGNLGPKAAPAVPALTRFLSENPNLAAGLAAIDALGRIGPAAGEALTTLKELARQRTPIPGGDSLEKHAMRAILKIKADATK